MWKALNSGIFIWFLSTLVGVFGAFALKQAIEIDSRISQLRDEARKIDLEIEGRLAQFASWVGGVVEIREENGTKSQQFRKCVTPYYLSRAVRSFGDPPNTFANDGTRVARYGFIDTQCETLPVIRSIYQEYAATSLPGLFATRISVERNLIKTIATNIWVDKALLAERREILNRSEGAWKKSISPVIDPTAPAGFDLSPDSPARYDNFVKNMNELFYSNRGGPEVFYYGDCFMC